MLVTGTRLGPYEVVAPLGSGGMGEVYRARDAKLGRDVAIKVLPAAFAKDPDRLARLEREARLLASLNHPHIATAVDGRLMAVPVRTQPALEVGAPMPLFAVKPAAMWKDFDIARDGRKILAVIPQSRANEQPLSVIVNWTAGLAAK